MLCLLFRNLRLLKVFWLFCNNLLCTVLIDLHVRLCEPRGSKIEKWTGCPTDLRVAIADELFVY